MTDRTYRRLAAVCMVALATAACATPSNFVFGLPEEMKSLQSTIQFDSNDEYAGAYVVIQWPASIDPAAEPVFKEKFAGVNGRLLTGAKTDINVNGYKLVDEAPHAMFAVKSTYYALELFEKLNKALPGRILLDPGEVTLAANGDFVLRSANRVQTPSAMVVRFSAAPTVDMIGHVGTRATMLAPFVSAATSPSASAATDGALFRTGNLAYLDVAVVGRTSSYSGRQAAYIEEVRLGDKTTHHVGLPSDSTLPMQRGKVLNLPTFGMGVTPEYLVASASPSFRVTPETIENPALDVIVNVTVQALQVLDLRIASEAGLADYAQEFDADLATRLAAGKAAEEDHSKIEMLRAFATAEAKFLSDRDIIVADTVLNSENFGQAFRTFRLKEKEAIDNYSTISLVGGVLGLLTVGAAYGVADIAIAQSIALSANSLVYSFEATASRSAMGQLGKVSTELGGQLSGYAIDLPGQTAVKISSLDELKARMKAIWNAKFDISGRTQS